MSFSSSTVLKLSGGEGPGGGGGGVMSPMTTQPPANQLPIQDQAYNRPAPHRRARQRPAAAAPGGQHTSYSVTPGGGQYYGSPRGGTGTGTGNAGQSYGTQNMNQGFGSQGQTYGTQNVNQTYGAQNVNQTHDIQNVKQTRGSQDVNRQRYGTRNVSQGLADHGVNGGGQNVTYQPQQVNQAYNTPEATTGWGQPFPAQPSDTYGNPATPQLQTYGQSYGSPQPVGHTYPPSGPQSENGGYGYQEAGPASQSREVSNQGYKRPGADQAAAPVVKSNIQTLSATTMALPPEVLAAYRRKFDHMDLNKDGVVTIREFMAVSRVFGYKLTKDELAQIFGQRDLDDSGGVTFDEFVTAMEERKRKSKHLQPIRQQFRLFDIHSRGYLTADDLAPRLERELGFDESKTEGFFDLYDKNKDYRISHLEFVDFYKAYTTLKAEIENAFKDFDRNGDGFVDIFELNAKLAPKGFGEEEVQVLMKKYDKDMDNRLSYQEFAAFWDVPIF